MAQRYGHWQGHDPDERRRERDASRERDHGHHDLEYPGGGFGSEHRGYAHAGSSGYEGGPGYGLPGDYGSNRNWAASPARRSGGFGPEGGGYGSQSSYAAHGGYGSPGERWQSDYGEHGGYRSQGYGTHAGFGSQGGYAPQGYGPQAGYGPRGEGHWPQSSWAQQGRGQQRRGPKGYKRSDERIREDICERLMHSDFIDSSDVTVEVNAGKVVIDGTVPERGMKHAIEDMACATSGVSEVENKVRVQQPSSQGGWAGSGATGSAGTTFGSAGSTFRKE